MPIRDPKGSCHDDRDSIDWETVLEATRLRTSHTAKLFHNQEPQRRLKKPRSRIVEPTEGTEGSCNHSMAVKTLGTRLGQERTLDWDESGGHCDEKRMTGWWFGARKSGLRVRPCKYAELKVTYYRLQFLAFTPTLLRPHLTTKQLSYQICPYEGAPAD